MHLLLYQLFINEEGATGSNSSLTLGIKGALNSTG